MKAVIAKDKLLAYSNHNKKFYIETDRSDYQLRGLVFQKEYQQEDNKTGERDIAFYTRKLNSAQKNFSTIEKELLSIVITLKDFRTTLLRANIDIFTDNKNLTYKLRQYQTQRVIRCRLMLEEFKTNFQYIPGATNAVADALSRVPSKRL